MSYTEALGEARKGKKIGTYLVVVFFQFSDYCFFLSLDVVCTFSLDTASRICDFFEYSLF